MEIAVNQNNLCIPLIDVSQLVSGDYTARIAVSKALTHGFQTAGFVYLKKHFIPQTDIEKLFSASAKFFKRPQEEKDRFAWGMQGRSSSPGYTAHGQEKLTQSLNQEEIDMIRASNLDMKEAFDVGLERIEGGTDNIWPGDIGGDMAETKLTVQDFFEKCRQIQVVVMRGIALGLGLEESFFDKLIDEANNTLRCLHYPAVKAEIFESKDGSVRAGPHSDYGSITLLFQDNQGGLQVHSANGKFVHATPIPGTIVVNAGDMLSRWANDTIKSTVHRVIQPPTPPDNVEANLYQNRYSVAYFCNPNMSTIIEALPGTWEETGGKKYTSVTAREWLMKRLLLAHAKTPKFPGAAT